MNSELLHTVQEAFEDMFEPMDVDEIEGRANEQLEKVVQGIANFLESHDESVDPRLIKQVLIAIMSDGDISAELQRAENLRIKHLENYGLYTRKGYHRDVVS